GDGIGEGVAVDVAAGDGAAARTDRKSTRRNSSDVKRTVDGGCCERHVDVGGAAIAVVDGDGEAVGAVVVRIRGVGVVAGVRIDHQIGRAPCRGGVMV